MRSHHAPTWQLHFAPGERVIIHPFAPTLPTGYPRRAWETCLRWSDSERNAHLNRAAFTETGWAARVRAFLWHLGEPILEQIESSRLDLGRARKGTFTSPFHGGRFGSFRGTFVNLSLIKSNLPGWRLSRLIAGSPDELAGSATFSAE